MSNISRTLIPAIHLLSDKIESDIEVVHEFLGFGRCKSECKVEIWMDNKHAFVLLTDLGVGTSVTNASEQIITEVFNKYLGNKYLPEDCSFSETYDRKEGVDLVIPKWENKMVVSVDWKHIGKIL